MLGSRREPAKAVTLEDYGFRQLEENAEEAEEAEDGLRW